MTNIATTSLIDRANLDRDAVRFSFVIEQHPMTQDRKHHAPDVIGMRDVAAGEHGMRLGTQHQRLPGARARAPPRAAIRRAEVDTGAHDLSRAHTRVE